MWALQLSRTCPTCCLSMPQNAIHCPTMALLIWLRATQPSALSRCQSVFRCLIKVGLALCCSSLLGSFCCRILSPTPAEWMLGASRSCRAESPLLLSTKHQERLPMGGSDDVKPAYHAATYQALIDANPAVAFVLASC